MSGLRPLAAVLLAGLLATPAVAATDWENPVFDDADAAVRAALMALAETRQGSSSPRELFARFAVSAAERPNDPRFADVRRQVVDSFLVTFPAYLEDPKAKRTLDAFLADLGDEQAGIARTLERFGYPALPGLIYLKLVANVAQLQDSLGPAATSASEQIAGVTYFCRYVVIPLSYITPQSLEELRSASLDSTVDVNSTLRAWQRDSFRVMLSTFRHELIHVWTNASLGPPRYRDRDRYPTWFLEGSAAFLAADPHSGLSERYKRYQNLFFYLSERHGVTALHAFFERILAGASARESLEATYGILGSSDLRQRQERWRGRKDAVSGLLTVALLAVVVGALALKRLPVFGSLQLWLAVTLAYGTFSGFCESLQALNGATAVVIQQLVLGAGALLLGVRGLRSVGRTLRAEHA